MPTNINTQLIKTRFISFAYEACTLLGTALLAALSSPDMRALITEHWGTGLAGTVGILILMEGVKHLRNLKVLKDRQIGGKKEDRDEPIILI